jgi:hypothetical protein
MLMNVRVEMLVEPMQFVLTHQEIMIAAVKRDILGTHFLIVCQLLRNVKTQNVFVSLLETAQLGKLFSF